jgi:hypothetical protein
VEQVALVPDQGAVQEFASAGLYPASVIEFILGVQYAAEYDLDPRVGEDGVEQGGELPVAVPDVEPRPAAGVFEVRGMRR